MIHERHIQTDRQTDRQTTIYRKTAICTAVHRVVKSKLFSLTVRPIV